VLGELLQRVVSEWAGARGWTEVPVCILERPAEEAHGDYATPVCLQTARTAKQAPRELAEDLRKRLLEDSRLAQLVDDVQIAGPGFLNFTLSNLAYVDVMREMLERGDRIGARQVRESPRVNLEFVSVNPNGPLHVGHGRYAAYGDSLKRLLEFSGANVSTEFYINDYGRQMDRFGRSIAARYAQSFGLDVAVPADGYQGDYVVRIAEGTRQKIGDRYVDALRSVEGVGRGRVASAAADAQPAEDDDGDQEDTEDVSEWPSDDRVAEAVAYFRAEGCTAMLEQMRVELLEFGVTFDVWFSETSLHEGGKVRAAVERLLESGEAFKEDGAVLLRTTSRGDDKDRVVIRSNGHPTYFAADIAYHESKLERGFGHLIDIWGADHHGYVPRMKAAVEILSGEEETLEVIIGQLVNLLEKGELRQMSTRRGEMVTLAELVQAVGRDAARFFLVSRSHDQTLDLDLDLARSQSQENPVYYVQYAHARISSIVRNAGDDLKPEVGDAPGVYESAYERALIKRLESFGDVLSEAAERRAPHRIVGYSQEVAADFHVFYKHCRVIGVEPEVGASRLALCMVTKHVIARCLDLLGVSAPENM